MPRTGGPCMAEEEKKVDRIRFAYQKGRHHRTFHADGAWASVTPHLEVQFSFFSDLRPMPEAVVHLVTTEGNLGEEIARQVGESVIRDTDVTVVMNKDGVRALIEVLERMVTQIDDISKKSAPVESQDAEDSKVS